MSIEINSLNGVSKAVAQLLAGNSDTLDDKSASVFNQVDSTVRELTDSKDLTFSKVFQAIHDVAITVKDFFRNSYVKIVKFCKSLTNLILKQCSDNVNHDGNREDLVAAAEGYIGKVPDRKIGNMLFSNNRDEEWCADTVSTIVKDIVGNKLPSDFGNSKVSGLMQWGKSKGAYVNTARMSSARRREYLLNNIKPGDIMIEKINKSHTGIVTRVYEENGVVKFDTIEGNMGSRVATERHLGRKTYTADSSTLSGFVQLGAWLDKADSVDDSAETTENIDADEVDKKTDA